jgi:hypothetical protein
MISANNNNGTDIKNEKTIVDIIDLLEYIDAFVLYKVAMV